MTQHRSGSEKKGGGRKPAIEQQPQLLVNFLALLAEFTAGDPMREGVLWTNLSRCEISRLLLINPCGTRISFHQFKCPHDLPFRNDKWLCLAHLILLPYDSCDINKGCLMLTLRSTFITNVSSLLRATPPQYHASVLSCS